MPLARRALIENPLSPQRDQRDEHDDEIERRVVGFEIAPIPAELAAVVARDKVVLAVVPGPDPVDGGGHFGLSSGSSGPRRRWKSVPLPPALPRREAKCII